VSEETDYQGPVFTSLNNFTIVENELSVGVVSALTKQNGSSDGILYSLGGADEASLDIDSISGQLTFTEPLNFDVKAIYSIEVTATVGLASTTQDVSIFVTSKDDAIQIGRVLIHDAGNYDSESMVISGDGNTFAFVSDRYYAAAGSEVSIYSIVDGSLELDQVITLGHPDPNLDLNYAGDVLVAISTDSNKLCLRVYRKIDGIWSDGSADYVQNASIDCISSNYGADKNYSMSLNKDGDRFALSRKNGSYQEVNLYEYTSSALRWDVYGQFSGAGRYGEVVSLSDDGLRVAITSPDASSDQYTVDSVDIYEKAKGQWLQLGQSIPYDLFGNLNEKSMALSGDGSTVAVTTQVLGDTQDCSNHARGRVKTYRYNGSQWVQIGSDIVGQLPDDCPIPAEEAGRSLALSADGSRIIIGGPNYDPTPDTAADGGQFGRARIFDFNGADWVQKSNDIIGSRPNQLYGIKADISADGTRVIIGGYSLDRALSSEPTEVKIFQVSEE
jgi:hypothetical protein